MKKICLAAMTVLLCGVFGCQTPPPKEEALPLDITLKELETKMLAARDPNGIFAKTKTYAQRNIITVGRQQFLMDVKFENPGKFRITTLIDNEPASCLILNGDAAWLVDYKNKKVNTISGRELEQMKILYALGNPDGGYSKIFAQVNLTLCRIENKEYYKLECISKHRDQHPLYIYVGKDNFLIKRMSTIFKSGDKEASYDSEVKEYALSDGVITATRVESVSNGMVQKTEVVFNKLDAIIPAEDFWPPVFK